MRNHPGVARGICALKMKDSYSKLLRLQDRGCAFEADDIFETTGSAVLS